MYAGVGRGGRLNQRFVRGYGWRTFRWIVYVLIRRPKSHSEKTYENRQWSSSGILFVCLFVCFFPWHVVANYALSAVIATSPDSILAQI